MEARPGHLCPANASRAKGQTGRSRVRYVTIALATRHEFPQGPSSVGNVAGFRPRWHKTASRPLRQHRSRACPQALMTASRSLTPAAPSPVTSAGQLPEVGLAQGPHAVITVSRSATFTTPSSAPSGAMSAGHDGDGASMAPTSMTPTTGRGVAAQRVATRVQRWVIGGRIQRIGEQRAGTSHLHRHLTGMAPTR
jgi:hypothetical protein